MLQNYGIIAVFYFPPPPRKHLLFPRKEGMRGDLGARTVYVVIVSSLHVGEHPTE